MNAEKLAELLNGREYRDELTSYEERQAKEEGLVIVFGASDDLVEIRGAIHDELDAFEGVTFQMDKKGVIEKPIQSDMDEEDFEVQFEEYLERKKKAVKISAIWNDYGNPCWEYRTDVPHETFDIMEDGEVYCKGIVLSVNDL
jgi:hypothetical protein